MAPLRETLTAYFVQLTAWSFLVALLLVAYVLTQMAGSEAGVVFLRFAGSLALISAPVLLFVHLRDAVAARRRRLVRIAVFGLFGGGVLLYGPTLQSLPFTSHILQVDGVGNRQGVRLLFGLFILLEGYFWWQDRQSANVGQTRRNRRLSLTALVAVTVLLLSIGLVLSNNAVQEMQGQRGWSAVPWYLSLILQTFLVYFAYFSLHLVHHRLLFRKLFQRRGVVYYMLGVVGLLLVFTPLHAMFARSLPAIGAYQLHTVGLADGIVADIHFTLSIGVVLLSLPYVVIVEWYRKERAITRLENEKTTAELSLLKEQINPHFFFNTLNNLYAMSLTREARTPETILQLSELMRYVIYRGKGETVTLEEEIKYLQDYLDLQSIRLQKRLDLQFVRQVDDPARRLPPLLFVILLENAFKHGIEPAEEACFLHLRLRSDGDKITFTCRNSYESRPPDGKAGGLGLVNLRRRLDLLYPGRYTLQVGPTPQGYSATLSLLSPDY